jgi:hypothetical protein
MAIFRGTGGSVGSTNNSIVSAVTTQAGIATTKAGEASASATTATTKASEASASATTASTEATEATASATTASTKATEANTAKTGAETAQTAAESARDTAQTHANTANNSSVQTVAGISTQVQNVNNIRTEIQNVDTIKTDVSSVSGLSDELDTIVNKYDGTTNASGDNKNIVQIDTVADNIASVNNVGNNIANVNAVHSNASNINTVAADGTDIGTVSSNISNVNTVAGISSNVTTVAGLEAKMDTVIADASDIGAVAGNIGDVTTVSGINSEVDTVAGIAAKVTTVADNITDVQNADTNAANASTSASQAANSASAAGASATTASTKATEASNSATAASNSATTATTKATEAAGSATTAGTSASTATTKASEASASATTATTKAGEAASSASAASGDATTSTTKASEASASATSAATSATNSQTAANAWSGYFNTYLGSYSAPPTVDSQGNALQTGAFYYDTGAGSNTVGLYVYNGSTWVYSTNYNNVTAPYILAQDLNANGNDIISVGNVGIGITSPVLAKLNIKQSSVLDNNGLNGIRIDHSTGTAYSGLGLHYSNTVLTAGEAGGTTSTNLLFRTAITGSETERMRISYRGFVGIGESNPTAPLHIKATTNVPLLLETTHSGGNSRIRFRNENHDKNLGVNNDGQFTLFDITNTKTPFTIANNVSSNTFVINGQSKVGIGTNAPDAKLDVVGDIASTGAIITNGIVSIESATPRLRFKETDLSGNNFEFRNSGGNFIGRTSSDDFATQQNRMVLKSNGDVQFYEDTGTTPKLFWDASEESLGVGTNTPAEALHVTGNIRLGDTSPAEVYTNSSELRLGVDRNNDNDTSNITFYTNNDEKVCINKDGKVGIGTSSPTQRLHIDGGAGNAIARLQGDATLRIDFGTSSDPDAGRIEYLSTSNAMRLFTANTERMRINSSGNVGIGTSSPDTLLEVVGANPILTIRDSEYSQASTNATLRLAESGGSDTLGNYWDINHTSNGQLRFVQDKDGANNERMRIDASGHVIVPAGITLGTAAGTYNAANTLDDYEEGNWTMSLREEGTGNISSSTNTNCKYTKIGRVVHVQGHIVDINNDALTGTGNLQIIGLPFTQTSDGGTRGHGSCQVNGFAGSNVEKGLFVQGQSNTNYCVIKYNSAGTGASIVSVTALANADSSDLFFSLTYTTT